MTIIYSDTLNVVSSEILYNPNLASKRILTKPSKGTHNNGKDNKDYNLILSVNDIVKPSLSDEILEKNSLNGYLIKEFLGDGTFCCVR